MAGADGDSEPNRDDHRSGVLNIIFRNEGDKYNYGN